MPGGGVTREALTYYACRCGLTVLALPFKPILPYSICCRTEYRVIGKAPEARPD